MVFDEEIAIKTFDHEQDRFVPIAYKIDLELLEKQRYVATSMAQLVAGIQEIIALSKKESMEKGKAEALRRLKEVEKQGTLFTVRLQMFEQIIEDTQKSIEEADKKLAEKATVSQFKKTVASIETMEGSFEIISSPTGKTTFLNLVNIVETLRKRVGNLETLVRKAGSIVDYEDLATSNLAVAQDIDKLDAPVETKTHAKNEQIKDIMNEIKEAPKTKEREKKDLGKYEIKEIQPKKRGTVKKPIGVVDRDSVVKNTIEERLKQAKIKKKQEETDENVDLSEMKLDLDEDT
jgi:hypothetical protein